MRDLVYFLKGGEEPRELKYSLRSLVNLPHRRVWFLTPEMPDWVTNVGFIPWDPLPGKYTDLGAKWNALPHLNEVSEDIYVMDDDFYVVKPVDEVPHTANLGTVEDLMAKREQTEDDEVLVATRNTARRMHELGYELVTYPCQHVPFAMNRGDVPRNFDDGRGPYDMKIAVFSNIDKEPYVIPVDPKASLPNGLKLVLWADGPYMSSLESTFKIIGIEKILEGLFPDKCEYER